MKRLNILLLFLFICVFAAAQTQQGYVKTRGRMNAAGTVTAGARLSGATLNVRNASSIISGNKGTFSFVVPSNTFCITGVQKQGYVLCDNDILNKMYKHSSNPFVVVMETPENNTADRLAAERKIRATLRQQLQNKEDEIEALKAQQKITEAEYNRQLQEFYAQHSENEKLIAEMANRYSTIDFDQLDEFQRQVAFFIQNGELTCADSLLNTKGSMADRSAELDRMDAAIKADAEELARRQKAHDEGVAMKAKVLADFAADCYSRHEICKLQHKNDSAAYWLELRASKDTMNIEWLVDYGRFVGEYLGDYRQETKIMQKACAISTQIDATGDTAIDCMSTLSLCYKNLGMTEVALKIALEVLKQREAIHGEESGRLFPKDYSNIASIYDDLREFDKSFEFYQRSLEAYQKNNMCNAADIVWCYNNIGYLYNEIGKYDEGLHYLEKARETLLKIVGNRHPDYAITLTDIGGCFYLLHKTNEARKYFEESLSIFEENYTEEHPKIGTCYQNLASICIDENDIENALAYTQKAFDILQSVYGKNHEQVATLISNRGAIYEIIKDYDAALRDHIDAAKIFYTLFGDNSQGSIKYAVELSAMAGLYDKKNNLELAEKYYRKAIEIEETIFKEPSPYLFNAYMKLASFYENRGKFLEAADSYKRCEELALTVYGDDSWQYSTSIGGVYYNLTSAYAATPSTEILALYCDYMASHVLTSSVLPGGAAAQQGMDGEYVILQIEDWTPEQPIFLLKKLQQFSGHPKRVVVYQEGQISEHYFEDKMGMQNNYKKIDIEVKAHIDDLFRKWKKKNKK